MKKTFCDVCKEEVAQPDTTFQLENKWSFEIFCRTTDIGVNMVLLPKRRCLSELSGGYVKTSNR